MTKHVRVQGVHGFRQVVSNGYLPERDLVTGVGSVRRLTRSLQTFSHGETR